MTTLDSQTSLTTPNQKKKATNYTLQDLSENFSLKFVCEVIFSFLPVVSQIAQNWIKKPLTLTQGYSQ